MTTPTTEPPDVMEGIFRRGSEDAERQAQENREQRLTLARMSVKQNDRNPHTYIAAARCCKQLGELYEALDILRSGLDRCPPSPSLHEYYIERLEKCNRTEEAIAAAREAALQFPNELIFRLREELLLPIFYNTQEQVQYYRNRFTEGLHRLIWEVQLESPRERQRALEAIGKSSNKYLPYQGRNDRELQTLYGEWVQRIMKASFPNLTQPIPMPQVEGKVRIGYLSSQSARFLGTSAEKLFSGWIREHDRNRFEIFAYHADRLADVATEHVQQGYISFRQLSGEVAEIMQAIRSDHLHVLVYLDFGLHPRMAQLAALRLAPIQCVAWDTPLTSGIPAMDCFLSSELMEPADAIDHYSEELVTLPGVGVSFQKPVIPKVILSKHREDFDLREDSIVYLCCQSIFKYSPEQDLVVARIAKQVPDSQFVFLVTNEVVASDFKKRIDIAFNAVGLRSDDYCVWMREMNLLDFWNLNLLADVALDTLGWSGGVTTFEAIACGLPVVTLPGRLMRARHSYAILTQLGVTETIARTQGDYVDIAVRLGLDRQWRQRLTDRIVAGYPQLYSDTSCVGGLEDFCRRAIKERLRRT